MTPRLADRVAIVTGAGRGLGRSHALALAAEGASVVVNDLGSSTDGVGDDPGPAHDVVAEITRGGGHAVASAHDIADWDSARELVDLALTSFGRLDILVNNAGILRDRSFANMTEDDWDAVMRVHVKGHAAVTRHAFAHWRQEHKSSGRPVGAAVVNTTSVAGLFPNFGQANYVAAKAAIAALTQTLAVEGAPYGIRVNAVSPSARTRLVAATAGDLAPTGQEFDEFAPENVSPLVVWLASPACPVTGQAYQVLGRRLGIVRPPCFEAVLTNSDRWTFDRLGEVLAGRQVPAMTAEQALNTLLNHQP